MENEYLENINSIRILVVGYQPKPGALRSETRDWDYLVLELGNWRSRCGRSVHHGRIWAELSFKEGALSIRGKTENRVNMGFMRLNQEILILQLHEPLSPLPTHPITWARVNPHMTVHWPVWAERMNRRQETWQISLQYSALWLQSTNSLLRRTLAHASPPFHFLTDWRFWQIVKFLFITTLFSFVLFLLGAEM